jgi:hypothetical protein
MIPGVLTTMRLPALLFTAILLASPAAAQPHPSSSRPEKPETEDSQDPPATKLDELQLPVSVSKIREALETTPLLSLRSIDERPLFRIQIQERQRLEELLATLNFKAGPVPASGVYMAEQNRIMFPPVDNPLRQTLGAFNQSELLTILIENLVGKYLGGKAVNSISKGERTRAEAAAKDEVRAAVTQYCSAQPNNGASIQICDTPVR